MATVSPSEVSRIERGAAPWLTIGTTARLCAVVGLDVWLRAYPAGDAVRDIAHTSLTADFRALLPPAVRVAVEVPIGPRADLRAWDLVLVEGRHEVGVDLETRLIDAQALARRVQLKLRDSYLDAVLIGLRDTRANRAAYAAARPTLDLLCPTPPDAVLSALRGGRLPERSGVVFVARTHPDLRPDRRPTQAARSRPAVAGDGSGATRGAAPDARGDS